MSEDGVGVVAAEAGAAKKPCANCGGALGGEYCAACGQRDVDLHAPMKELVGDAIEDAVGLDSRIAHTVRPFLFRPGTLTREFIAGRRARYTSPVKLYVVASAAYFLVASTSGSDPITSTLFRVHVGPHSASESGVNLDGGERERAEFAELEKRGGILARIGRQMGRFEAADPAVAAAAQQKFTEAGASAVPKALFLMMPIFALLLRLFYRHKDRFYVDHLVMALHLHAFFFVAALCAVPLPTWTGALAVPLCFLYTFRALRVVYEQSRLRTSLKLGGLALAYVLVLAFGVSGLMFVEIFLY